ncbi:MAG: preprotein translocase subunit SecG [Patescibacteria group bacterium]
MQNALIIVQIVVSLLLSLLILIQERGSGLGEGIAGVGGATIQTKKRGAEKVLAQLTVLMIVLFLGLSLSLNFVQ